MNGFENTLATTTAHAGIAGLFPRARGGPVARRVPTRLVAPEPLPPGRRSRNGGWLALSVLLHAVVLAVLLLWPVRHENVSTEVIPIAWVLVEPEPEFAPASFAPVARAEPVPVPEQALPRHGPTTRPPAKPQPLRDATPAPAAPPAPTSAAADPQSAAEAATAPVGEGGRTRAGHGAGRVRTWMPRGGSQPPPVYPARARRAGIEGTAEVELLLESSGRVSQVRLHGSSGDEGLDVAALDAVRRWRFDRPPSEASWRGRWFLVPIKFRLE